MNENFPKHTLSIYVRNKPGVLVRVAQVFARRGYNIDSLVVSPTTDPLFSSMTIACHGAPDTLDQIIKQVTKLVDVVHCMEHTPMDSIAREMALFKMKCPPEKRGDLLQIVQHFKAETVDLTQSALVIQVIGSSEKLDAMENLLGVENILEMIRTGKIVITRGERTT